MIKPRFLILTGMILAAAATRLIPHPWNFAPITAIALFSGANFANKRLAFLVPLLAMMLSDLLLGLHSQMQMVYGTFMLIVAVGFWLRKQQTVSRIAVATLASSVLFFVVTNFGVWAFDGLYPKTSAGLAACYLAAIPFFQNSLLGDAFYTVALFGGFALVQRWIPVLRESELATSS